jgi:spore coat protein H
MIGVLVARKRPSIAAALLGIALTCAACSPADSSAPSPKATSSTNPNDVVRPAEDLDSGPSALPDRSSLDAGSQDSAAPGGGAGALSASGAGAGGSNPGHAAAGSNAPADTSCQPNAGGPYYLLEGESVHATIVCKTGRNDPTALSFAALPPGAAYDRASATLTWTPGLDQGGVYELSLRAEPNQETGTVTIEVADRWDAPANVPIRDPSQYNEEYGLPVLHLTTDPGLNQDDYTPATVIYRGHSYSGVEAQTRGATSAYYPKRSYTLKFSKDDKFSEPNYAGGFLAKRKVALITSFDDNSYLRQRLGFQLWSRLADSHINVQAYNVVVFLNGQYYGLYTMEDHIDGYLMEDFGLDQDGDLYKAREHDANFKVLNSTGGSKTTLHDGYSKEEGMPADGEAGAYDDLDSFISWVETSSDPDFTSQIDSRLRRSDYEDWWIWASFLKADDSAAKNSYHYHDPQLPSSLWRFVPWDLNESFGQDWKTYRTAAQSSAPEDYYPKMNSIFTRILADPMFGPAVRARYGTVLAGTFASDAVIAQLDAMANEIDASAHRDQQKWMSAYRTYMSWSQRTDFTTYDQELDYMRQWIRDRHTFLETFY